MHAKKSLGQHFLTSKAAVEAIVGAGEITNRDVILEIGPGKGILTQALLETGAHIVAVEKDQELFPALEEKFAEKIQIGKLTLVSGDILNVSPQQLGLKTGKYKIIANIPYYITGAILRQFLESPTQPSKMVLLIQKEVAERIVATDGKESLLSISIKAYGKPRKVRKVPAGSFVPAPKVDSIVLVIDEISKKFFKNIEEQRFFTILRAGFAHKRKLLAGNLVESGLFSSRETVLVCLREAGLAEKIRAEDVPLLQWEKIATCSL